MRTKLLQTLEQSLLRTGQMGKNAKVLVVSPDLARLDAVSVLLDSAGYHVFQSLGNFECLEAARSILPDIIVIDMSMDPTDASKVISALRAEPQTSDIPGLVMASRPFDEGVSGPLQRQCYFLGTNEDLPSSDLLTAINRCLLEKG